MAPLLLNNSQVFVPFENRNGSTVEHPGRNEGQAYRILKHRIKVQRLLTQSVSWEQRQGPPLLPEVVAQGGSS